jgi:anhydro-N-acetylmuramic acid kinase
MRDFSAQSSWTGLGSMSGTSMDGLDMALCRFCRTEAGGWAFELLAARTEPFPPGMRERWTALYNGSALDLALAHADYGRWMGLTIRDFLDEAGSIPDFAAIHGQTIFHQPERGMTFQLGDGEVAAAFLPCPLVSNFRSRDIALGGQGAPLIPMAEQHLFPGRLFLNLGGFSNLSYGGLAFDVAPCNIVLDHLFRAHFADQGQAYDEGGEKAAQGSLLPGLLADLDALPFYHQAPPRSLGWEWVEAEVLPRLQRAGARPQDLLHTWVVHHARQVAAAAQLLGAQGETLLATGGGRHNAFLMSELEKALAPLDIRIDGSTPAEWVDFKEAIGFAFLGLLRLLGQPTILPAVTGASRAASTGVLHLAGA